MQQLRIVWVAFLVTQLLWPVVAWFEAPARDESSEAWLMVAAVAGVQAGLSLAWGRLIATGQSPSSRSITRWAFAESVALLGLVTVMLGGPPAMGGVLMAVGFVLLLAQPPSST